ncbi:MAG: LamG-like jellyroll fold domain-containing protein [Actinomycetota bacterium]
MLQTRGRKRLGRGLLVGGLVASLTTIAAAPAQAATSVALWHMDEAESGTEIMRDCATDDGANDGTTTNVRAGDNGDPTVSETECEAAPDETPDGNHGYFFDGTAPESVVTVPDAASLNPGAADISFTAHVNFVTPPVATSDYGVMRKGPGSTQHYKMELKPNATKTRTRARCSFSGSSGRTTITKGPDLINGWHTITCFKTSNQIGVTVDGTTFTKSITIGSITNTSPVGIGRNEDGDDQYFGNMDELSITIG